MNEIIRIGMDTSKSVFQLHGVDAAERAVVRKKLRRRDLLAYMGKLPPTRIGMEACGGAHHWGRELSALGHEVVLVPAQYAKQYVMRGKNDAADAEAICEAMSRRRMRFVPIKTAEQQAAQMLVGMRDRLIGYRTQLSNVIRGYAAEFGVVTAKGLDKLGPLLERVANDPSVPELAKDLFAAHSAEYARLKQLLRAIDGKLMAWHRSQELSRRLAEIPGIGPISACRLTIKVTDPHVFRSGRDFAAWLGLTPKDHSTAGKQRLGVITRAGDESLRQALVVGATAVVQQARKGRGHCSPWLLGLLNRKPPKLAAVALANKTARIAWKLMVSGQRYNSQVVASRVPAAAEGGAVLASSRPLRAAFGGGLTASLDQACAPRPRTPPSGNAAQARLAKNDAGLSFTDLN